MDSDEVEPHYVPVSKIFYFQSSIYEKLRRCQIVPWLPLRKGYPVILFQDTHVKSSYILLIYVSYSRNGAICCGPYAPEGGESSIKLMLAKWKKFYAKKGPVYFRNEFAKTSIYKEYESQICNGDKCTPRCCIKNTFERILQGRNSDGEIVPFRGGGVFRFQDNIYYYYRGVGVYTKKKIEFAEVNAGEDGTSITSPVIALVSCGNFRHLEKWDQGALYCYIVMKLRI